VIGKDQFPARQWLPGQFAVTSDDSKRTVRIEGWVKIVRARRTRESRQIQKSVCLGLDHCGLDLDGGHLIPHCFGGPSDEFNLVAMERRANRSLVAASESMGRAHLDRGTPLYLRVSVAYADAKSRLARSVTHEYYVEEGGQLRRLPTGYIHTRTDRRSSWPMAKAVGMFTGGQRIDAFQSADPRSGVLYSEDEIAASMRHRDSKRVE